MRRTDLAAAADARRCTRAGPPPPEKQTVLIRVGRPPKPAAVTKQAEVIAMLPAPAGRNHRGHHEGDRLAAAFGAWLPRRGGPQELGLTLGSEKTGDERIYRSWRQGSPAKRKGKPARKAA